MHYISLSLMICTMLGLAACSQTPGSHSLSGGEVVVPQDLLLGLTHEQATKRLGKPNSCSEDDTHESLGQIIDYTNEHLSRQIVTWYDYGDFKLMFNMHGKSVRVKANPDIRPVKGHLCGLGRREASAIKWLGEPRDKIGVNIDAPRDDWHRTPGFWCVYPKFQLGFNLENEGVVMQIDALYQGKPPVE